MIPDLPCGTPWVLEQVCWLARCCLASRFLSCVACGHIPSFALLHKPSGNCECAGKARPCCMLAGIACQAVMYLRLICWVRKCKTALLTWLFVDFPRIGHTQGFSRCEAPTLASSQVYPYSSPAKVMLPPGTVLKVHNSLGTSTSNKSTAASSFPGSQSSGNGTCGVVGTVPVDERRVPSALHSKHYKFAVAPFMDDGCYVTSTHGAISEVDFVAWLASMCAATCRSGATTSGSSSSSSISTSQAATGTQTQRQGRHRQVLAQSVATGAAGPHLSTRAVTSGVPDVCGPNGALKRLAGPWVPSFVSASLSRGAVILPPGHRCA